VARQGYGPSAGTKSKKDSSILGSLKRAGGSALGTTFNILDKPGQAIRSGLARTAEASYHGRNPLQALGSFAEGAGAGLVGKDHNSISNIFGAGATGDRRNAVRLPYGVETVGGIITDPTTYLSLGAKDAAKHGLQVTSREIGENVAKNIATQGLKKAVPAGGHREALRQVLINVAMRDGGLTGEKAVKAADKQLAAMARSGRGGLKFAGRSVPGLTAESTIGKAASSVNPKRIIGDALRSSSAGVKARSAVIRGAEAESAVGSDIRDQIKNLLTKTEDQTTLHNAATEAAAQNLVKAAGLTDERLQTVLHALDIDPTTRAAQGTADAAERAAAKAAKAAGEMTARHEGVSRFVHETLTAKRDAVEQAKAAVEHAAAAIDGSDEARKALLTAQRVARVAQTDLERTAERFATSSARQGIAQMAGHAEIDANLARNAAEQAKAAIPENTKQAIAAMRASGDAPLADLTEFLHNQRTRFTKEQVGAGLLKMGTHEVGSYVPRYFTKQGLKALEDHATAVADAMSTPGRKVVSSEIKHAIHQGEAAFRKLRPDLSITELNDLFTTAIHGLPEGVAGPSLPALLKPGQKAVEDNAVAAIVHRAHTAEAAVQHVNMVKKVAEMAGPDGKPLLREIEANATPANGKAALDLVEDAGVRYEGDPAVVKLLNEAKAITTNDEALRSVQDTVAGVSRVWRSMATFGPAFHARNEAGNIWLNYLAGVRNPAHYARAARLQHAAHVAFDSLGKDADLAAAIKALKVSDADKEILKGALDEGVLTHGFFMEDLVRTPAALGGPKANLVSRGLSKANDINKTAGSAIENNARLAHYIAKLEDPWLQGGGARSVKKFLFDYGDLTPFEKHFKNFLIPFYTFMRKNAPLEVEQALLNPGKFTKYLHISQDLKEHGVTEQPDVPVSSLDDVLRPLARCTRTKGNRTTSGVQRRFQGLVAPLSPFAKSAIETPLRAPRRTTATR
jgi:hypothetical protein